MLLVVRCGWDELSSACLPTGERFDVYDYNSALSEAENYKGLSMIFSVLTKLRVQVCDVIFACFSCTIMDAELRYYLVFVKSALDLLLDDAIDRTSGV